MNTAQRKALAGEAFQAGVANGGDSSPSDGDYAEIQTSVRVAFEGWWSRHLAERKRVKGMPAKPSAFDSFAELAIDILKGEK